MLSKVSHSKNLRLPLYNYEYKKGQYENYFISQVSQISSQEKQVRLKDGGCSDSVGHITDSFG